MTYNILNGGQDELNFKRLQYVLEVVRSCSPDILVLNECMFFDINGFRLLYLFERELGMRGIMAPAKTGQHVALFIKPVCSLIETRMSADPFFHATIYAKLLVGKDYEFTVIGTHLNPFGGENRIREVQYLTDYARPDEVVFLLGDLNSLNPHEDHSDNIKALPSNFRSRHLMPGDTSTIDTRTIATLEAARFVDLFRLINSDSPDYTGPTKLVKYSEFARMRVDYIMGTEKAASLINSCDIIKHDPANLASDHYPVVADFSL
jgi:exodeoxyribonuclease-3